jgi:predicted glycogen debranching enzyme
VLTLQKKSTAEIASVSTAEKNIEDLLTKEWLLTNSRGGYASSTIVGCNTRRYHGLLIGALNPPVNRIMALANCLEMIVINGGIINLSTFEFNDKFSPQGCTYLVRFRQDIGVHFDYRLPQLELTKSVYLLRDTDTVGLLYDFTSVQKEVEFVLRPFIALRDFHTLQKSYAPLCSEWLGEGLLVHHNIQDGPTLTTSYQTATSGNCKLLLKCTSANFEKDEQWWFNFVYRNDRERGQDFTEDLWTPGFFKCKIEKPTKIIFWASLCKHRRQNQQADNIKKLCKNLQKHQNAVIAASSSATGKTRDRNFITLSLAADQFISKRRVNQHYRTTILAGFPWFADWGRDAFVALPGLLLSTGRFEQAKSVLTTWAQAADNGMLPNRFDDYSDTAYFNSIDASLWFINAAFEYLNATGDLETFARELLPTIHRIIDSYYNGTRFDTHADAEGLITSGSKDTQLTWMDAKYEGVAFTPRYGKAVEINALWYNGLCRLAEFYTGRDKKAESHFKSIADKIKKSFCELFWNETTGCLNDCILPDGSVDLTLRPNQIFAVSLPFSPLPPKLAKCVVDVVQKELLTPYGLRTLNTRSAHYKGGYTGHQQQRDQAYHQGTVWPYLIGPFVEAYLKVNNFSQKSKDEAADFIEPLMRHLTEDGCLGQLAEIFDGDPPHHPKGCIAQAWSIAELIRAYLLINS